MLPLLTAYDPLGGSSGSIDPLGAMQTYGALAEKFLPGVTTITTRSRYLSMLCAALANAEKHNGTSLPGASGLAHRRRAVEPFERLWALACVAAKEDGVEKGAFGLRGITYAQDALLEFSRNGKRATTDFPLLKYQGRTGAVGTYWTALVSGQLIYPLTGELSDEGRELAHEFKLPPLTIRDLEKLADPEAAHHVSITLRDLSEWAGYCNLVAAREGEWDQLSDALTASEERYSVARALLKMANSGTLSEDWDSFALMRLKSELTNIEKAVSLGLPSVVDAIPFTEKFHEAVLTVFHSLLWWGTTASGDSIEDWISESGSKTAGDRCRETAAELLQFRNQCERVEIRTAMEGLTKFAFAIDRADSTQTVVDEIFHRHHQIQSGKVNGGAPKRDWISLDAGKLLRPSARFQRSEPPTPAIGRYLTHPYRIEPFVYMLRENRYLPELELN